MQKLFRDGTDDLDTYMKISPDRIENMYKWSSALLRCIDAVPSTGGIGAINAKLVTLDTLVEPEVIPIHPATLAMLPRFVTVAKSVAAATRAAADYAVVIPADYDIKPITDLRVDFHAPWLDSMYDSVWVGGI